MIDRICLSEVHERVMRRSHLLRHLRWLKVDNFTTSNPEGVMKQQTVEARSQMKQAFCRSRVKAEDVVRTSFVKSSRSKVQMYKHSPGKAHQAPQRREGQAKVMILEVNKNMGYEKGHIKAQEN